MRRPSSHWLPALLLILTHSCVLQDLRPKGKRFSRGRGNMVLELEV
jgi:hypothetical protein